MVLTTTPMAKLNATATPMIAPSAVKMPGIAAGSDARSAIKPTSAATSTTNPIYTLTGTFLASHTPITGGVGELVVTSLSFQGGTLTKATS